MVSIGGEGVGAVWYDVSMRIILILGGARSGKSTFAERLAARSERSVAFIATATATDDDMRARIARHRADRPATWHTVEEALHLAAAVQRAAAVADVLLLDCITTWLANWLFAQDDPALAEAETISAAHEASVLAEVEMLLKTCSTLDAGKTVVVVSNEVGLGIVPAYPLGRAYRDILGRVNQRLAVSAARVYLMVAGLAVDIKRLHEDASL